MELEEVLEVSVLLNYYKNLLTDKQKDYLIEHLEEDMSLSEIAKKPARSTFRFGRNA